MQPNSLVSSTSRLFGMPVINTGVNQAPASVAAAAPAAAAPAAVVAPTTPAATPPPGNTNANVGAGTGTGTAPTQAQLAGPLAQLAQLDQILQNKNAQSQAEHDAAINGYNNQDTIDQQALQDNTHQNEQTYTKNNHAALLNAANASTGLRGVLASLGALGGSGLNVVDHLVGLAANSDTGAARDTFDNNASTLSTAGATMDANEKQRRADAESLLHNNMQNNEANVLTSRQSILQTLAGLFGPQTSGGNDYASQAASLAGPIANTTQATVAPYQAASSLFSPATLKSYLGGTQKLNVDTTGGATSSPSQTPINSPSYIPPQKKAAIAGVA